MACPTNGRKTNTMTNCFYGDVYFINTQLNLRKMHYYIHSVTASAEQGNFLVVMKRKGLFRYLADILW